MPSAISDLYEIFHVENELAILTAIGASLGVRTVEQYIEASEVALQALRRLRMALDDDKSYPHNGRGYPQVIHSLSTELSTGLGITFPEVGGGLSTEKPTPYY